MKIWTKTLLDHKITRDHVYEKAGKNTKKLFENALREICESIDIPCPLILSSHYNNFFNFNIVKFLSADFVESIDFDTMTIENITDE